MHEGNFVELPVSQETLIKILRGAVEEGREVDPELLGVVLFGSYAKGNPNSESDVDIMSIVENPFECRPAHILLDVLKSKLKPYDLRTHYSGIFVQKNIKAITTQNTRYQSHMRKIAQIAGTKSIIISPLHEVIELVGNFIDSSNQS